MENMKGKLKIKLGHTDRYLLASKFTSCWSHVTFLVEISGADKFWRSLRTCSRVIFKSSFQVVDVVLIG